MPSALPLPPMPYWLEDLLRFLSLRDANTRTVLLGTALLGLSSGIIGSFGVLRRRALVGDAVAHASLPGVCIAFLIVGSRSLPALLLGALASGVIAAATIAFIRSRSRIREDAAIALVIGSFFGLGIVLSRSIQSRPDASQAGLDGFIFGKAASMVAADAMLIAVISAVVLAGVVLLYKEFKLLCFDRGFSQSIGRPVAMLDLGIMALICLCTVAGLPAVGIVLMVALLIAPGVAARCWTEHLHVMLILAGIFGTISGVLGTALSAVLPTPASTLSRGWPTGPMIVLVASAIFAFSILFGLRRGIIPDLIRRSTLRRRVALQNLLRAAWERTESEKSDPRWTTRDLPAAARWSPLLRWRTLSRATRRGLIARANRDWILTPLGRAEAARIVRAHRLWENYLIQHADIAPDHVDRDADEIEHLLPADLIARLDAEIAAERDLPPSPHPLRTNGAAP